ncbi:hypothetical protein [Clostridium minihomine]|uniref:hypothetical protein n=1 Tax=Clostridium minihomine TaxID=2045012 RepID=UPI000C77F2A2|nr:hypothetical protein [Clostridium minihomine]
MRKLARRLAVLLCSVCLFSLFGCSSAISQPAVEPILNFQAKANVTMDKNQYVCNLDYSAEQGAQLTLLVPQELEGMSWSWDKRVISIAYEGLTVAQDSTVLPDTGIIPLLLESLDAAAVPNALTTSGDGLFFGSTQGHNFTITVDRRSGQVKQLDIPERGFKAIFEPLSE